MAKWMNETLSLLFIILLNGQTFHIILSYDCIILKDAHIWNRSSNSLLRPWYWVCWVASLFCCCYFRKSKVSSSDDCFFPIWAMRMTLGPNIYSIRSFLCSLTPVSRETESPAVTDTDLHFIGNTWKTNRNNFNLSISVQLRFVNFLTDCYQCVEVLWRFWGSFGFVMSWFLFRFVLLFRSLWSPTLYFL